MSADGKVILMSATINEKIFIGMSSKSGLYKGAVLSADSQITSEDVQH